MRLTWRPSYEGFGRRPLPGRSCALWGRVVYRRAIGHVRLKSHIDVLGGDEELLSGRCHSAPSLRGSRWPGSSPAVSRPEPNQSDHPPSTPGRHRRRGSGGHLQARVAHTGGARRQERAWRSSRAASRTLSATSTKSRVRPPREAAPAARQASMEAAAARSGLPIPRCVGARALRHLPDPISERRRRWLPK